MPTCLDLEIGTSLANMTNLRYRGIPDPDSWTYQPYSTIKTRGDGRYVGFGFPTASWQWETLSQQQLDKLLSLFSSDTDASVVVYIYTYTDSGPGRAAMRARFKAVMDRPRDGNGKNMIRESTLPVYTEVVVRFTHLESV